MKKIQFFKLNKDYFKIDFIREKITVNKAIIIIFALLCLYIVYLSLPSFYSEKLVKNKIQLELNRVFNSDSVSFDKYSYSIFPKPHYKINNILFIKEKSNHIAKIKKVNLIISQKNFFKKNDIKVKKIQFINGNFYLNNINFKSLKKYIKSNYVKFIQFKKGNFFIVDNNFSVIAIAKIKSFNLKFNKNNNSNELLYKGQIFNLPFKLKYNIDLFKKEAELFLNFKKINLNFKNISRDYQSGEHKNEIQFLRTKFNSIIKYDVDKKNYNIQSKNSVIQQTEIDYLGNINFDPFYFEFKFNINNTNYQKLFFLNNFFEQIIINYLLNNHYINGEVLLNIKKIKKHKLFKSSQIKINLSRGVFDLSDTIFNLGSIGKLKILSNKINHNEDKLELLFNVSVTIDNYKKLHQKFLTPKKNRQIVKNIIFDINLIPSSGKVTISNFFIDKKKVSLPEDTIKTIESWQEFKNLANNLFENYEG